MKGLFMLGLAGVVFITACGGGKKSAGREVQISVTEAGFEPARAMIPKGQPITLVISRKTDQTCAKEIVISSLNIRRDLPLNQAVRIELPADVIGDSLSYACGMDMYAGAIIAQ